MKDTILAIAGRPGLYRLISQGRGMLIVESIDAQKKRMPAGARDRVTALNEVSMYTEGEDRPRPNRHHGGETPSQSGHEAVR